MAQKITREGLVVDVADFGGTLGAVEVTGLIVFLDLHFSVAISLSPFVFCDYRLASYHPKIFVGCFGAKGLPRPKDLLGG